MRRLDAIRRLDDAYTSRGYETHRLRLRRLFIVGWTLDTLIERDGELFTSLYEGLTLARLVRKVEAAYVHPHLHGQDQT